MKSIYFHYLGDLNNLPIFRINLCSDIRSTISWVIKSILFLSVCLMVFNGPHLIAWQGLLLNGFFYAEDDTHKSCKRTEIKNNSRPRSIYGQYPCPAFLFFSRFSNFEQGSGPRETMSCGIQGIFCPSVRPSIRPSVRLICSASYRICWLGSFYLMALALGAKPGSLQD